MKVKTLAVLFTVLLSSVCDAHAEGGIVRGKVSDFDTKETIIGVHVIVAGSQMGTVTDFNGEFEISGLEAGVYTIEFRYIGYQPYVQSDVVVRNHRPTILDIELRPNVLVGDEIVVRSTFFIKDDSAPVSRIGFNAEEIRRSPGAGQELSMVMMLSPGVAASGDTSQDLLVRGGSPSENGFYIDHIPVPGVNHFERQNGRSNGPIGIINTDLVQQIDFYTGGFSPVFGNHASSVANIRYREGSRERFHGNFELSMAGFGVNVENPIAEGKGSLLFSARRSYLDIIANAINAGGAPRYGDVQFKGVYDVGRNNRITILNIYGDSLFESDLETAIQEGYDSYAISKNSQNTAGINWRRIWGSNLISNTSVSRSFKSDKTRMISVQNLSDDLNFDIRHSYTHFRNTNFLNISDRNRLEFGAQVELRNGNYDYYFGAAVNESGVERSEFQRHLELEELFAGMFVTWLFRPVERVSLSIGSRLDHNSLNKKTVLSPRTSISVDLTESLSFNASAGIYRQTLPAFFRSQNTEFKSLNDYQTRQLIMGLAYQLNPETLLTVEVYDKQYFNLPSLPQNHGMGGEIFVLETETFFEDLTDNGRAYARGIDFLLQKKLAENFYGMVSGSLFRTKFKDSRGNWQRRAFDVKTIFNVIGGYRPNNRNEVSVRWSYIGNRPYTPLDEEASAIRGRTVLDQSRYHQSEIPAYHSLFIRYDRRWFYNRLTLTTFLEMWNAYNRSNVEEYYWNVQENRVEAFHQFSILPIGGIKLEF